MSTHDRHHIHTSPLRLGALMFFQLFVFGSYVPVLPMYLRENLGFSGSQIGLIMALAVVSSIVAPLLSAYVIDRKIRAPKLFMVMHGLLLLTSLGMMVARDFWQVLGLYLLNSLCTGPLIAMLNAITFQVLRQETGSTRDFGAVRVWGTVGWMVAGYSLSALWWLLPTLAPGTFAQLGGSGLKALMFGMAALGSMAVMALAAGIPGQLRKDEARGDFIPREALAVLLKPSVALLALVYLISSILDRFYSFGIANYLRALSFGDSWVPTLLTLGQVSEIFALFGLGALLAKLDYKKVLLIGALAQVLRFALFVTGLPGLALAGIFLNGVVMACLFSVVIMYMDSHAAVGIRSSLHQLIQLFLGGVSTLVGNLASGWITEAFAKDGKLDFFWFWTLPLCFGLVAALVLALAFRPEKTLDQA